MQWLAELVRFTVFTVTSDAPQSVEWWQSIVGEQPSESLKKNSPPLVRDVGPVLGGAANLVMEYQAGRIDWLLIPNVDPNVPPEGFPNIGNIEAAIEYLLGLIQKWLPQAPAVNRLALGGICLYPVSDRATGYKELQGLMPAVKLDSEGSTDFSYSINRPRVSNTPGQELIVNRLSKWGVIQMHLLQFTAGQVAPIGLSQGDGATTCRVELDINSSQSFNDVLPIERLKVLSDEFSSLMLEIINKGDIP